MHLKRDQRGFTIIELLVSMTILAIIIAPLSAALIGYIRNTDATSRRMNENHDVQITAAYFAQDVQAMGVHDWTTRPYALKQSIETNVVVSLGNNPCGSGTAVALVRFEWDNPTDATTVNVIRESYVVVTPPGTTIRELHRVTCVGSSTPVSDIVLAHELDTTAPVVTCVSPSSCTAAPGIPQQVQLTLTIRDPGNTGSPLVVTLVGQRRQT